VSAAPAKDLVTIEPLPGNPPQGRMVLNFHPGQWQAWNSTRRFVFIISGTQGGKTSFGPHWLYREIKQRGAGDYLGVTATYPLLKLKMLPEFLKLFRDRMRLGEWLAADRVFQFSEAGEVRSFGRRQEEPTRVIFGSAANPESLESATAKGAWIDECGQDQFGVEAWDAIIRRLSIHLGRVLGTTTPYNLGWVKQQLHDRWKAGDQDIEIVQFDSIANPRFPREEYERARATLPDWKFRMFYRGQFERPPGLIYADFIDAYREDGGHKVHPFDVPPEWPRYVGLDFGAVNTALVWIAHDPRALVSYVYRESLTGGKSTAEHAADALAVAAGTNVVRWMGGAKSESQQRMDWNAAGVKVREPEVYDVEAGIDRVIALWKTFRLYVFDTCTGLLDELGSYARELDERNEPTEKIKHKERYHRLDALRYIAPVLGKRRTADVFGDEEPDTNRARPQERATTHMGAARRTVF
jgi:hypothetical protein